MRRIPFAFVLILACDRPGEGIGDGPVTDCVNLDEVRCLARAGECEPVYASGPLDGDPDSFLNCRIVVTVVDAGPCAPCTAWNCDEAPPAPCACLGCTPSPADPCTVENGDDEAACRSAGGCSWDSFDVVVGDGRFPVMRCRASAALAECAAFPVDECERPDCVAAVACAKSEECAMTCLARCSRSCSDDDDCAPGAPGSEVCQSTLDPDVRICVYYEKSPPCGP